MAKLSGSTNYKLSEVRRLLALVEHYLPLGKDEWERLANSYNANRGRGVAERDHESLRRKFKVLYSARKPTGVRMTPAGETVGDVSSRRRSWRCGYGPAVARRSLRAVRPSRASRRGVGDGSRGRGDGGSSSKTGDDVVGLRGFRVGGGVAGVAGAVSDAVGALGAEAPAVEAFVGGGFDTSFGVRRPCWGDIQGGRRCPRGAGTPGGGGLRTLGWCLGTASLHVLFFTRRVQDASCAPVHGGVYEASHYCAY
ncbi:hypothetical protein PR003_g19286 [Phytophthora rubi]|uniref:DUF6818 domain-containing protein n=1 Tax=Phytophthora rubi TaxID=129364 RepID=A0A6A4DXQ5_9STRA|nr:hypothetical protein PR003_g19286 [Phytophthora rubi]